jgi:hypothetical protein
MNKKPDLVLRRQLYLLVLVGSATCLLCGCQKQEQNYSDSAPPPKADAKPAPPPPSGKPNGIPGLSPGGGARKGKNGGGPQTL